MSDELQDDLADDNDVTPSYDSDREKLLCEWWSRWKEVRDDDETTEQWQATHIEEIVALPAYPFVGTNNCAIYMEPKPGTVFETDDPAWKRFAQFSDRLLLKLKRGIGQHTGIALPDIEEVDPTYVLDNIIAKGDTVLVYGGEKEGKSTWAHKLAICIASTLPFDNIPIMHGRVLYVTLDPGARQVQVKRRMAKICTQLGITQPENLIVVQETTFLDDPLSVESLLRYNPGSFVLVIIDPLYRALTGGDPSSPKAINEAIESVIRIIEQTGAAVMILNHDTKAGGMYGSKFLGAAADCKIFVKRNFKTNVVTVEVELVKNGEPPDEPFKYQLKQECLSLIDRDKTKRRDDEPANVTRTDMLALIPFEWTATNKVRELIEHMLSGEPKAREKEWYRIRENWEAHKPPQIEQQTRKMRRIK